MCIGYATFIYIKCDHLLSYLINCDDNLISIFIMQFKQYFLYIQITLTFSVLH